MSKKRGYLFLTPSFLYDINYYAEIFLIASAI